MIVAALKDEVRSFLSKMSLDCVVHFKPAIFYRGKFLNKEMELLITGIGTKRMQEGLAAALALNLPKTILLVGYAGGTSPIVKTGSLILAEEIINANDGSCLKVDAELLLKAKKISEEEKFHYQLGKMVTVNRIISNPHEKADIGATHSAIALDMESAALAKMAFERKIPFLIVKSILDPVEETLPLLEDCVGPTGEPKPLKLAEHLFKNPREMMQLPRMQLLASQARASITKFVEGWVQTQ